jgi:hypothetical protein
MWDTDKIVMYVGNTIPSLFVECYAARFGKCYGCAASWRPSATGLLVLGDSA